MAEKHPGNSDFNTHTHVQLVFTRADLPGFATASHRVDEVNVPSCQIQSLGFTIGSESGSNLLLKTRRPSQSQISTGFTVFPLKASLAALSMSFAGYV